MKDIIDDFDNLLIWPYLLIEKMYKQTELQFYLFRFSNNNILFFTGTELITCAVFADLVDCKDKNPGYQYIRHHYLVWFHCLPSYKTYNHKLNKFKDVLAYIFWIFAKTYNISKHAVAMIDTAPIGVCKQQNAAYLNAAQSFVSKGYCSTKKEFNGKPPLTLFQKAENSIHSSTRQPIDTLFKWNHKKPISKM